MAKPTKEDAREAIERLGLPPNRFGHYTVGDYKLKFLQRAIRVERRFKYESGGRLSACGPAQAGPRAPRNAFSQPFSFLDASLVVFA